MEVGAWNPLHAKSYMVNQIDFPFSTIGNAWCPSYSSGNSVKTEAQIEGSETAESCVSHPIQLLDKLSQVQRPLIEWHFGKDQFLAGIYNQNFQGLLFG